MSDDTYDLKDVLRQLDAATEPLDEHDVHQVFSHVRKHETESGNGNPLESVAEYVAFMFHPDYHWGDAGWKSYYGPQFGGVTAEGDPVYTPDIFRFDGRTFEYWARRAKQSRHPLLRIRYADLCWDLQKRVTGVAPDIDLARIVIDCTIDAARRALLKPEIHGVTKLTRAMGVALAIGDQDRVQLVRDAVVTYEDMVARDESAGLWGFSYDLILENRGVTCSDELEHKIIGDLERRLERLTRIQDGTPLDPWGAEYAALRLARYFRRLNRTADMRRALLRYGEAFGELSERASGIQASAWLEAVHDRYRDFGMREEAEALLPKLQEFAKKSHGELAVHTQKIEVPTEKIDRFLESLMAGDLTDALQRIVRAFLTSREQAVQHLEEIKKSAPLMSMVPFKIVDGDGRPTAQIGSVENDLDGRVVHHLAQVMDYSQMYLHLAFDKLREKYAPSVDDFIAHLTRSPVFSAENLPLIREGLACYLRGDLAAAAHLLVTQIEAAIRRLLSLCGGNTWKPNRGGILMLKNLDDLLREEAIKKSLSDRVVLNLRVLLTDQRGWNLRNNICHGLLHADHFGRGIADRLVHALLVLAMVRESGDTKAAG